MIYLILLSTSSLHIYLYAKVHTGGKYSEAITSRFRFWKIIFISDIIHIVFIAMAWLFVSDNIESF